MRRELSLKIRTASAKYRISGDEPIGAFRAIRAFDETELDLSAWDTIVATWFAEAPEPSNPTAIELRRLLAYLSWVLTATTLVNWADETADDIPKWIESLARMRALLGYDLDGMLTDLDKLRADMNLAQLHG